MSIPIRAIAAGNWKMNGTVASTAEIEALVAGLGSEDPGCDVMICPPATLINMFAQIARGSRVEIGAQDCHANETGAHTGDLSGEMLAEAGATTIIVGHSERR